MRRFALRLSACALATILVCGMPAARASDSLKVGSDISYAPLEFYSSSHRMQGFDIDLAQALAKRLGQSIVVSNHNFGDLIPAVKRGSISFAISALSDTRARESQVDFVDYLLAGSGMLVRAGNPKRIFSLSALCGLQVDVQRGTSQEQALKEQSKQCGDLHLAAISLLEFDTDDQAFQAFTQGKSDVHVTDFPVAAYLAKTNDHKYEVAGRQFDLVPYGIAIAKGDPALRTRVVSALQAVIADGEYDALLKKWGLEQGALRSAPLDAGTLFSK